MRALHKFLSVEDGAITVDWVVLTAGIIGLCLGLIFVITSAATDEGTSLGAWMGTIEVE